MKIMILGYDGYIGFPLTLNLLQQGHEVFGVDNLSRRKRVEDVGGKSLTPINSYLTRKSKLSYYDSFMGAAVLGLGIDHVGYIRSVLSDIKPEVIVHLAEQPSAPYSMISPFKAGETQRENVMGTLDLLWAMKEECPNAHLVKLGTMGEYGTPNCEIPEGKIPNFCLDEDIAKICRLPIPHENFCPMAGLMFPRTPGSFYHLSKVHDTHNIAFACRNWGLRSTDIMQGVVFGLNHDYEDYDLTRFDYDEYFGTAINRFCAQALIGHPLTVYGAGNQTRGFLPLQDSIECLKIAITFPPVKGEYRTFNQFENIYSINGLAQTVQEAAVELGLPVLIQNIPNPRVEAEQHFYNPTNKKLLDLGYVPTTDIKNEIVKLLNRLIPFKDEVIRDVIKPKTNWR